MRIRILIQHVELSSTGRDGFYFTLVLFFGTKIHDCTLGIDFSAHPPVQALLDLLLLPSTPEHLLPGIFAQFLTSLKKHVPDLEKYYFISDRLDSNGRYSYSIDQAQQKREMPIEGELEFVPANLITLKLPPVTVDFEKLREKKPIYCLHRFRFFEVPVLINRTNYSQVKVFLCRGTDSEKAFIHCYFIGNRIKGFKLLRSEGFDRELARYCFEFLKSKLQLRYQFV